MEISQSLLGLMYVWAVVAGAVLGASYDVLRLSRVMLGLPGKLLCVGRWRRVGRHALLFVQDVLFGLIGGLVLVLLLYYTNDGQFRGLAVVGMLSGFFVYYYTLGGLVRLGVDGLTNGLERLFRTVAGRLRVPLGAMRAEIGKIKTKIEIKRTNSGLSCGEAEHKE